MYVDIDDFLLLQYKYVDIENHMMKNEYIMATCEHRLVIFEVVVGRKWWHWFWCQAEITYLYLQI